MKNEVKNEELRIVLENHQHWINEDSTDWALMRADLTGADLHSADLKGAYLKGAYLRNANLEDADVAS